MVVALARQDLGPWLGPRVDLELPDSGVLGDLRVVNEG